MDTTDSNTLIIGWWNTGLSPLGKSRSDDDTRQIAQLIVKNLIDANQVSMLALGEINCDDLINFMNGIESKEHDFFSGIKKETKLHFDIGAIYNTRQLELLDSHTITSMHAGRNFKIATRLDFKISSTSEFIHFFISHWPSKNWRHTQSPVYLGATLKDSVKEIKQTYKNLARIILIGDYNDEPFDQSLSYHLLATRDRTLAQKNDEFFYNPFWRRLGESEPFSINTEKNSVCGTYYYKNGDETKWRTFDQIMVSSSFLGNDHWFLDEQYVLIWQHPLLIDLIKMSQVPFDHLPILGVIQRKNQTK